MNKIIICLIVIVVLIFIGILFILFVWNKSKTKKLFGGMGSITEYGSTVYLYGDNNYFPMIFIGNDWNDNITNNISDNINEIAKNPLKYFTNEKQFSSLSFYKTLISDKRLRPIYDELVNDESDRLNIEYYIHKIFRNLNISRNILNKVINSLNEIPRKDKLFKKINMIAQGNSNMYTYIVQNQADQNYHLANPNYSILNISGNNIKANSFRSWYGDEKTGDGMEYLNIFPGKAIYNTEKIKPIETSSEPIEYKTMSLYTRRSPICTEYHPTKKYSLHSRHKCSDSAHMGIADIFPAKRNASMAYKIYIWLNKHLPKNNERSELGSNTSSGKEFLIQQIIAIHILEIYLINIYGHFTHHSSYNSSISDNFFVRLIDSNEVIFIKTSK